MPSQPSPTSANFAFLIAHDRQLDRLGALAERYFADDPTTCLMKLRQFGELLAQRLAARAGYFTSTEESQLDLLRRLRDLGVLPRETAELFHGLRVTGNRATHDNVGDTREALHQLKMAWKLGVWFHRTFHQRSFDPGPFVPPRDPAQESAETSAELQRLRDELASQRSAAEQARIAAAQAAEQRLSAEQQLAKAAEERAIWEALAAEVTRDFGRVSEELAKVQAIAAQTITPAERSELFERAEAAAEALDLDESDTRRLVDAQLRALGWEVDSETLVHAEGARPQKGRNLAIAEWPTATGPADYVLFVGLQPLAVVEAKRMRKDVSGALEQAKRYSRGFALEGEQQGAGGPWGDYVIPFLFATNGRPFLRQLATKSGIWFLDARRPTNLSRPLDGWHRPEDLAALLRVDIDDAQAKLAAEPTEYLGLRDYQLRAIAAVEQAIAAGQRSILVAMATGTGKTRTCIGLTYRLLKTRRVRRVLFLVDRSALGEQTAGAYKEARLEQLQAFTDIFDLKELADVEPESDTKLHIATVQGMVKRVLMPDDPSKVPAVGLYDCIVVDECHRGYLLDRELGDSEFAFRDESDYVSKYRRVLDHFDAIKIGLTATPAKHTSEIFGAPVFRYGYTEAVVDGVLVDHEPPLRIVTRLAEDGIHWATGEEVVVYDTRRQATDTLTLPDDVDLDIDSYNRRVITEDFNRVVCDELARHIDPSLPTKTLIFCVNDSHADLVVQLLKQSLAAAYGEVEDDAVVKITATADKPLQLIRRFKNERNPNIVVTVDLLTTGVDVPAIGNIVFLRRVRSRILYEQMKGRATRRCDEIGKEVFRIFDAVDLYAALQDVDTMKPVVVDPKIGFAELVERLLAAPEAAHADAILDQLVVKLRTKTRRMTSAQLDAFESAAGLDAPALIHELRHGLPSAAAAYFRAHPRVVELLEQRAGKVAPIYVSNEPDELLRVEVGYGPGRARPADYLASFAAYLSEHLNELPALVLVTQRPRELTRAQLKQLRLDLAALGYGEATLQSAWRDASNQDIAASIIGFIRRAALGDALIPYGERVDMALRKILASHNWTKPQRDWLKRIADQLRVEIIVDREALDRGQFKTQGGFQRIDKVFEGRLEQVLGDLHEALWA
jgi:type I restriction enzyme R subunit